MQTLKGNSQTTQKDARYDWLLVGGDGMMNGQVTALYEKIKATPWNFKKETTTTSEVLPAMPIPAVERGEQVPDSVTLGAPRAVQIRRTDLEDHVYTAGCRKCERMRRGEATGRRRAEREGEMTSNIEWTDKLRLLSNPTASEEGRWWAGLRNPAQGPRRRRAQRHGKSCWARNHRCSF